MVFTPKLQPYLFDEQGVFDAGKIARFFAVQKLDFVLVADGVGVKGTSCLPASTAFGAACLTLAEARATCNADACAAERSVDFALAFSSAAQKELSSLDKARIVRVHPLADRAYTHTPLVNLIACEPGFLILQNETPARRTFVEKLRSSLVDAGQPAPIRVAGAGWEGFERVASTNSAYAYAIRSSRAVILFGDAESESASVLADDLVAFDNIVGLALADGVSVVSFGGKPAMYHGDQVCVYTDQPAALKACLDCVNAAQPAPATCPQPAAASRQQEAPAQPVASRQQPAPAQPVASRQQEGDMLEDVLDSALAYAMDAFPSAGSANPRSIACVFGYFSLGNFGDEYILETVDYQVRSINPGASLIAVSENPVHTFVNRGIYAVEPLGKSRLDAVLVHACVALVTAGLLFDQGIRWMSGKSEVFSNTPFPDIPGLTGFMSLASMNGALPLMHGIGAGPLDVADARKLVAFMGRFGTVYAVRDRGTFDLIKACGVSDSQVALTADTAFLAPAPDSAAARKFLEEAGISPDENDIVAVSLRNYENMPPDFAANIAVVLDTVLGRSTHARVVFCILDADDARICGEVAGHMRHASETVTYDSHDDVQAMAGMLSLCKTGVSMRYHASLLLMTCGKPCVGIGYLPKVNALFDEMGASDALLDMSATADELYAALDLVLSNYETRAAAMGAARETMVERANAGQQLLADALVASGPKAGFVKQYFYLQDTSEAERRLVCDAEAARAQTAAVEAERNRLSRENAELRARLDEVEHSTTYRVGKALMKAPTALKDKLSHKK